MLSPGNFPLGNTGNWLLCLQSGDDLALSKEAGNGAHSMCHQGLGSRWASGLKAPWFLTIQWPRQVRRIQKLVSPLPGGGLLFPEHAAVSTTSGGSCIS